MTRTIRIGLSARLLHPDNSREFLPTKSLHYVEECVAHWVMSADVLALMIPAISQSTPHGPDKISIHDYVELFDGLVLQGGADVAPESYGDTAIKPEWAGDKIRDAYELELVHAFIAAGKPVLGVCRGMQIINVALGGTLYQDIPTQVASAANHRCELAACRTMAIGGKNWLRRARFCPFFTSRSSILTQKWVKYGSCRRILSRFSHSPTGC